MDRHDPLQDNAVHINKTSPCWPWKPLKNRRLATQLANRINNLNSLLKLNDYYGEKGTNNDIRAPLREERFNHQEGYNKEMSNDINGRSRLERDH